MLEDRLLRLVSRTPGNCTRRTATVTISAPEASWAAAIISGDGYLPVPTMRRDRNVRPAIVRGVSMLTATDEVDDLYLVAPWRRRSSRRPLS